MSAIAWSSFTLFVHVYGCAGGEDILSADDEEEVEEEESPKEKKTSTVFCDATKQLLIERPPLVLTLHMKRFLQHGRRLRKNNRHVSFSPLLDIAPFCEQSICHVSGSCLSVCLSTHTVDREIFVVQKFLSL